MLTALAFVRATGLHADERHADALSLRIRPTHSRTDWLKKNQFAPQRLRCDLTIGWGSIAIKQASSAILQSFATEVSLLRASWSGILVVFDSGLPTLGYAEGHEKALSERS